MASTQQVGGMQDVFIQTADASNTTLERTVRAVERVGGQVRHAFPPSVLIASVPSKRIATLAKRRTLAVVTAEEIPVRQTITEDRGLSFAVEAWNEHFNVARRLQVMASAEAATRWDAAVNRLPPDPPPDIREELDRREAEMAPAGSLAPAVAGAPNFNIPVLVGRIGVGVVFVDSTVSQFQITDSEKSKVVSEITEGLNMLSGFEPRAGIQWFYDFKRPKISLAANLFTEANKNSWEDIWRNAAIGALGFSADTNGMNTYINGVKTRNNASWAYAIFVTKYPKTWFAYEWANHIVMDFQVDGWGIDNFNLVVAHETGHVFGCPDEYSSSGCNCTSLFGRYQVPNGNCENCASPAVACLMSHNAASVCDYTRGHLGWNELAVQSEGSTVLKGTWTFDLDSGVQGPSSGADIWWEQVDTTTRFLVPQSGAMLKHMGSPNFDAVSRQTLQSQSYSATPINGSNNGANQLQAGSVIAVRDGCGALSQDAGGVIRLQSWD